MRPLPAREPDLDRRWVTRVPPDPHVRFDTNDYSLDPNLVGRRVEVRVSQREIVAVALDSGEQACRHERVFAKNKTITALEHARTLRERRGKPGVEELTNGSPKRSSRPRSPRGSPPAAGCGSAGPGSPPTRPWRSSTSPSSAR
jgi:hypothetical protein